MKTKPQNKIRWITPLLALTLGLSVANGEMLRSASQEVVYDTDTKLMWQDNLEAKTVKKDWQGGIDYCSNLIHAGFDEWRLPDKYSLRGVYWKKEELINKATNSYWTSSPDMWQNSLFWAVDFGTGTEDSWKSRSAYGQRNIRCVLDINNTITLNFASFLKEIKTSSYTSDIIVLNSKIESNEQKLLLVQHNNKNYFGTKAELIKQLDIQFGYSKNPFETIQKLTQQQLNEYLTIAPVVSPTLPKPLNLLKDEFESKAEFAQRVTNETSKREAEILRLQDEFRAKVEARNKELENRKANIESMKKKFLFDSFASVMGNPKLENPTFDAETNTMFVDVAMSNAVWKKKIAIKMEDRNIAKNFKYRVDKANAKVTFGYENDGFVLQNIEVGFEKNNFIATLDKSDFKLEKVAVTIENKKVAFNELQNPNLVDKYQVLALGYGESNQAKGLKYNNDLIPMIKNLKAEKVDSKKWLFVVAVENYDEADAVTYAKNSAEDFVKVAQKRLGISERNTYALIDDKATSGSIKDRLDMMLQNVKDRDSVYFYYSGHGIPNPNDGEAYILPKDKIVDYVTREKEFMVRNIYKQLSDSKAGKVIAFMDSCFSGNTDGISNIKGVAATRVKTKKVEFDKDKMVVLTAGTANQFSNMYKEKGHRLFSYFLTKAMIERPSLEIDSIYKSISVDVKDESHKMGDLKIQEPQMEGNNKIEL